MEYTLETAEKMAENLRALPEIDNFKRKLNKQGVVKHLAREISALQDRGYTIEQIAESLVGVGLEITTPTLKSYLQRIKKDSGKARQRTQKRTAPASDGQPTRTQTKDGKEAGPRPASRTPGETPSSAPRSTRSEFAATDREKL